MKIGNRIAISALAGLVALLLFYQTPLMRHTRAVSWQALTAVTGRLFSVGSLEVPPDVQEQLQILQAKNISLEAQLKDYARLKHELGSEAPATLRAIPAAVIGRPSDTFQTQFIISRGLADGVTLHAPVVIRGSTLIGSVKDVSSNQATVELLLNPAVSLAAEVVPDDADQSPARGLLQGRHFTSLVVTTIPRDIKISSGQAIVTAASDQVPYGLFLGIVEEVTNKENEPYQTAEVKLPYAPDAIEAVSVLVQP